LDYIIFIWIKSKNNIRML